MFPDKRARQQTEALFFFLYNRDLRVLFWDTDKKRVKSLWGGKKKNCHQFQSLHYFTATDLICFGSKQGWLTQISPQIEHPSFFFYCLRPTIFPACHLIY